MTPVLNAKGKPFSWSYSRLADFETCPRQYAAKHFYCTAPFHETEAIIWGNRVHALPEKRIKGIPHDDPEAELEVQPYLNAILSSPHKKEAEVELALTRDMRPCKWFDKNAWLRAKIDVVVTKDIGVNGMKACTILDWKTGGKIKDNDDQIRLNFAALSVVRPSLVYFDGKYIWTKHKVTTGARPASKEDIPAIWAEFLPRVHRMEDAWNNERFPPKQSGLCSAKWCPVEGCEMRRG